MELNYSKKQINPLIAKYQIDVERNVVFQSLILLFNDQPNYQVWAIKSVFEGIATVDDIRNIHTWAENNPTEIKNLVKGNIVSYKTRSDFQKLFTEMNGLNKLKFVCDWINRFNTAQKKMLREQIITFNDGFTAENTPSFKRYFNLFESLSTLPKHRQEKLISTSSAINDFGFLIQHIENALSATYSWEKEDMLGFMARNCQDCNLVYEKDNIVVVNVNSFDSSKKLCGGGRTGWCLTRQESYFKSYTKDNNNAKQYFIFNFDKREDHELAHIGVSVNKERGITHSHTTKNNSLMGKLNIDGKQMNIYDALTALGIPKNIFIHFSNNNNFEWNVESFLNFIDKNREGICLSYSGGNRFVVNVLTKNDFHKLCNHTFLNKYNFEFRKEIKQYIMFDFNLDKNDDNSIITLTYGKDNYNIDTLKQVMSGYGVNLGKGEYLSKIGISTDMFLNRENVDPKILLHKYIDECNEKAALELLKKHGCDLDINYEFNNRIPIFSAIEHNMFDLFSEIIEMKNFNSKVQDCFCENLFQSLLYKYVSDCEYNKNNTDNDRNMIIKILQSKNFNVNEPDLNEDTAAHIACEYPNLEWVLDGLLQKENVDFNIVNDFNCTPLGVAIQNKNISMMEKLLKRTDVVVRDEDFELADSVGINLKKFVENRPISTAKITPNKLENSFAELFAKALKL